MVFAFHMWLTPYVSHVPLNKGSISASPKLKGWIGSWIGKYWELLTLEGWYTRKHDHAGYDQEERKHKGIFKIPILKPGAFVWDPPPAAMQVAMEQLRVARLKRQASSHIILCPKLFTPYWFRQLNWTVDCLSSITQGSDFCPSHQHESLFVAICFPFLNRPPW